MEFKYKPKDVCPSEISFNIDGGVVTDIKFNGGCNGNLKMLSKLLNGKSAEEIVSACSGNLCGRRPTSCADQLALAVEKAAKKEK